MEKKELRPIEWHTRLNLKMGSGNNGEKKPLVNNKGYFHMWQKSVSEDGHETVSAVIEKENGEVFSLDVNSATIIFKDRVEEEVSI